MASDSSTVAVDRQVCWEQIERTGHPFRFTRIFADKTAMDRLLAVYAFCAVFERLAGESTDEEVSVRKLDWWRFQCDQQRLGDSKHPVLRELVRTSEPDKLESAQLFRLIELAAIRIDARPVSDLAELRDLARQIGNAQVQLEATVFGIHSEQDVEAMGFAQLIRESSSPHSTNPFWWLPMNLLATHGLSRGDVTDASDSQKHSALISDLLSFLDEDSGTQDTDRAPIHSVLLDHLNRRQLARCRGKGLDSLIKELNRQRFSDVVSIWRRARSLG